jgi:hypothetical protein
MERYPELNENNVRALADRLFSKESLDGTLCAASVLPGFSKVNLHRAGLDENKGYILGMFGQTMLVHSIKEYSGGNVFDAVDLRFLHDESAWTTDTMTFASFLYLLSGLTVISRVIKDGSKYVIPMLGYGDDDKSRFCLLTPGYVVRPMTRNKAAKNIRELWAE